MEKRMKRSGSIFGGFISIFFLILLYLTYYSHIAYLKSLLVVESVMPKRTEEFINGRYLYIIPEQAVWRTDDSNSFFIYTLREHKDIFGQRNLVTVVQIYVKKELSGGRVLVDGIIREEPVIMENLEALYEGQEVLQKNMRCSN